MNAISQKPSNTRTLVGLSILAILIPNGSFIASRLNRPELAVAAILKPVAAVFVAAHDLC